MQARPRTFTAVRATVVGAVAAALCSAACTTVGPPAPEQQNPKQAEPQTPEATEAAIAVATPGAVAGWISGDERKERRRRALLGLGVAGLTGDSVGDYMDGQEAKLRKQLQGSGVSVTRIGDNVTLSVPGASAFATDSATLKPQFHGVLDSVALVLKEHEKTIVEVAGHTDDTGSEDYNQALSERRAGAVGQYLQGRGVSGQRLVTIGAGETRPVASPATPEGRQQNRRIELTLAPLTAG